MAYEIASNLMHKKNKVAHFKITFRRRNRTVFTRENAHYLIIQYFIFFNDQIPSGTQAQVKSV